MLKYVLVLSTATALFFTACGSGNGECCGGKKKAAEIIDVDGTVVKTAPTAVILSEKLECTIGETLKLDGLSDSNDKDGTVKNYAWSIDDNNISSNPQPSISCSKLGTQEVCLTVTDDDNLTSTQTCKTITVKDRPNIKPIARITGVLDTCTIGDAIDAKGDTSSDEDGEVISYAWSDNAFLCDTLGIKEVCLTVTDNDNQLSDQNCTNITVLEKANIRPIAKFTPETLVCTEGETISLDAITSSDEDGTVQVYNWNQGTLTGVNPTFACERVGTDKICLTVTDNKNLTSNEVCKNIIVAKKANIKPVAKITNLEATCEVGTQLYPAYSESSDIDGNVTSVQWMIDNITVLGQDKPVVPCKKGEETFCLTVQDNDGATSDRVCTTVTGNDPIVVQPETLPPIAVITFGEYDGDGFVFDCSQSADGDTVDSDQTPQNDKGPITSIWEVMKYWKNGNVEGPHGGNTCQKWIGADDSLDYMEISLTVTDDDDENTTITKTYTFENNTLVEKQ